MLCNIKHTHNASGKTDAHVIALTTEKKLDERMKRTKLGLRKTSGSAVSVKSQKAFY